MSKEYPCIHYYDDGKCKYFSDDKVTSYCTERITIPERIAQLCDAKNATQEEEQHLARLRKENTEPTAKPSRKQSKHGRWEYLQDDEWRCSNCHTIVSTGGQWTPMTDEFCRNCGAKMDLEE